ncbi:hypothetical protein OSB04_021127 [Centaurea solstitialis]|uniref:Uncharacterized protein n=1 Tax=Centaurea solstitialis TaxID=347529 RepID=A0AA38WFY3_9ASTR|nr:hypothetical protein OSB04_021127 [Centaurea solstitialis]
MVWRDDDDEIFSHVNGGLPIKEKEKKNKKETGWREFEPCLVQKSQRPYRPLLRYPALDRSSGRFRGESRVGLRVGSWARGISWCPYGSGYLRNIWGQRDAENIFIRRSSAFWKEWEVESKRARSNCRLKGQEVEKQINLFCESPMSWKLFAHRKLMDA